jgi:hypothetical protein
LSNTKDDHGLYTTELIQKILPNLQDDKLLKKLIYREKQLNKLANSVADTTATTLLTTIKGNNDVSFHARSHIKAAFLMGVLFVEAYKKALDVHHLSTAFEVDTDERTYDENED